MQKLDSVENSKIAELYLRNGAAGANQMVDKVISCTIASLQLEAYSKNQNSSENALRQKRTEMKYITQKDNADITKSS